MLPSRRHRVARLFFLVFPLFLILFALFVWAVQSLWNGLLPDIFGVKAITYWQALGVMVLCWILFGGFRGARSRGGHWDYGMRRRWQRMTPAEREEFLQGLRTRWSGAECGAPPPPPAAGAPQS